MARKKSYQKGNVDLHNGRWTVRYREFDHASRKWVIKREVLGKFKNKKEARRASEPIMMKANERNNSDKPPEKPSEIYAEMTFRQFVESRWKKYTVSAKHQPSTLDCYGSLIKHRLLPHFGDKRLRSITPSHISDFLEGLEAQVAANTLQSLYSLLRLMFDIACEYDLIERSPVRSKLHRPETAKVEKPTLRAAEIRAILGKMVNPQERLFTLLIAVTGIRLGEGLALRWMDFNAVGLELQVNHTLYRKQLKQPKTKESRRAIRLAPAIAQLFVSHKEQSSFQAADDFIFCHADGRPLNPLTLRSHLHNAMNAAGIKPIARKHGYHIFRHSAGSLIYARSRDLKLVQGTLGHSNINTTSDIYVHLDDKVKGEGTEILAGEILANCDLFVTQESKMVS